MQFCKDCGTVLNLFGNNERELCSACIQHKKKIESPTVFMQKSEPAAPKTETSELLADTILSYENNKMVLRSKEGWELWSGAPGTRIGPQDITRPSQANL